LKNVKVELPFTLEFITLFKTRFTYC